jgi:hypothetical protein
MAFYTRKIQSDIFVGPLDGEALSAVSASYSATASSLTAGATASLAETASYALTASFVEQSVSASYAVTASYLSGSSVTSSYALTASYLDVNATASYALTASYVMSSSFASTASFVLSSSYAGTASIATTASFATSASLSVSSSWALSASRAISASFATTASHLINTVYDREIHVSNISGDDSGSGTFLKPFKTITKAFATVTSNGSKVIIHPGTYQESPTLTQANVTVASAYNEQGGIVFISGSLTINNNSTSNRISGITPNVLIITGSGTTYLDQVRVNVLMQKLGSGYMEVLDSGIQPTSGLFVNAGTNVFSGGNVAGIVQSGASTVTVVKNALSLTSATITGGTFAVTDSPIYSLTSGSAAINASAGTIVQLFNSQVATLAGSPERVAINGFFGYSDVSFNKTNSTLGTQLGLTADFQNIRGTLIGTASLASTASLAVTSSHTLTASYVNTLTQDVVRITNRIQQGPSFAPGNFSVAFGNNNIVSASYGAAFGSYNSISGSANASVITGQYNSASAFFQTVVGQFNQPTNDRAAFIIGGGSSIADRKNIAVFTSSSITLSGSVNISGSLLVNGLPAGGSTDSGSLVSTASFAEWTGSASSSFAGTASYSATASYANNFLIAGDLQVNGTASFKQVNFVSSSVVYESGSTSFGNSLDDTHTFTGSLLITGSVTADSITVLSASIGNVSGSITNAVTASYALTASFLDALATSSYALTASLSTTASNAITASYLDMYATASYALTASFVESASFALTASYLSGSVKIDTGSLVTTSSFNDYTSSLATTGSNQFQADQIITGSLVIGSWRLKESGSNLAVEKWDGFVWVQSGYFEI